MPTTYTIYLIRHAENPANLTHVFSCRHVDFSLTEKGILQAEQTADRLADAGITRIYTSPLKRAYQTASALSNRLGIELLVTEYFREVDVGELETGPSDAAAWKVFSQVFGDWSKGKPDSRFPGGEDYHECAGRFTDGLMLVAEDIRMVSGVAAIFGHGGNFITGLYKLFANEPETIQRINAKPIENCCISRLEVTREEGQEPVFRLISWAEVDHLHGAAAELINALPSED